jgi:hypothetical protein
LTLLMTHAIVATAVRTIATISAASASRPTAGVSSSTLAASVAVCSGTACS